MSIAIGKIRPATMSAGSCGAQSPGKEKVEIFRAEGRVEMPTGICIILIFASKSKFLIRLPMQRFGARIRLQFICFLMQSKFTA